MAKRFKEWDNAFSGRELAEERRTWLGNGFTVFDQWPYKVESWTQDQIRTAVYESEGSEGWQRFRVSMKGLSTYEKLVMCKKRWDLYNSSHLSMLEKCRIDNYILALKRGGQLDDNLVIVR